MDKKSENKKKSGDKKSRADRQKSKRIKYYIKLSLALLAALIVVALGMFIYLRYESVNYKNQHTAELTEAMENAKNVCYDTLKKVNADDNILESINTQYENAMSYDDIFQKYYLVDGIIDYTLTNFYYIISVENQKAINEGLSQKNYDSDINALNELKANLKTIKDQISNIDLDEYY